MRLLLSFCCFALAACPRPPDLPDAGLPEDSGAADAGNDAGVDAGRPVRDAGIDAGWVNVPESDWCHSQALARCWRDLRCRRIDTSLIDACIARNLQGCDSAVYAAGSAMGLHDYDAAAAVACLKGYDYGSCDSVPSDCSRVFVGRTPANGSVLVREDCDPDAGYFYPTNSCPNRCRPWARLGESCFDSSGLYFSSCQPGVHSCDYADAGSTTVCIPLQKEGDGCQWFYGCGPNLACSSGKCVKSVAVAGEACEAGGGYPNCDEATFCRQAPPPMMGTPPPGICSPRVGLGGTCVGFLSTNINTCLASLRCSSSIGTGTCQPRLGIGEACSSINGSSFFPAECMDGLYCDNTTSRCRPYPGDGGDCSRLTGSYNACLPGYYCDYNASDRCWPLAADGEPCAGVDSRCQSGDCQFGAIPDAGFGYRCVRCSTADAG